MRIYSNKTSRKEERVREIEERASLGLMGRKVTSGVLRYTKNEKVAGNRKNGWIKKKRGGTDRPDILWHGARSLFGKPVFPQPCGFIFNLGNFVKKRGPWIGFFAPWRVKNARPLITLCELYSFDLANCYPVWFFFTVRVWVRGRNGFTSVTWAWSRPKSGQRSFPDFERRNISLENRNVKKRGPHES